MSDIFVCGLGAVSPAGWGTPALRETLASKQAPPISHLSRPGWNVPLSVRQVPALPARPKFLAHARLRRTSPIAHYAVWSALEALCENEFDPSKEHRHLGIIFCSMCGSVNYSRRFYEEVLTDPATASPLVFPETVYNSPASHLAALLGSTSINYTLVGDPGTFLQGLALAAEWIEENRVEDCLVVAAEEMNWLIADSMKLFHRNAVVSDGAGAMYLCREPAKERSVRLSAITSSHLFSAKTSRFDAARRSRAELPEGAQLLCDGLSGIPKADADEKAAWADWAGIRMSPKSVLGEGLMAAAAWQCVAAVDALQNNDYTAANVSIVGINQQAIAARFAR